MSFLLVCIVLLGGDAAHSVKVARGLYVGYQKSA